MSLNRIKNEYQYGKRQNLLKFSDFQIINIQPNLFNNL